MKVQAVVAGASLVAGMAVGTGANLVEHVESMPVDTIGIFGSFLSGLAVAAIPFTTWAIRQHIRTSENTTAIALLKEGKADTEELHEVSGRVTGMTSNYERDAPIFLDTPNVVRSVGEQVNVVGVRLDRVEADTKASNEATARIERRLGELVAALIKGPVN